MRASLGDVLAAVKAVADSVATIQNRLEAVEEQVQEQRDAAPQMVPMRSVEDSVFAGLAKVGDETAGTLRQMVVGTDGLPRAIRGAIWPKGTRVRLLVNERVAERLRRRQRDPENLIGTIVGFHFVNDKDEPKYRVNIPGLTTPRGDGFYAHELSPA